jgi:hypothetical protein
VEKQQSITLVLETESIVHPLTGIGRYTYELAKAFRSFSKIKDLQLFNRGKWQDPASLESVIDDRRLPANHPQIS